MLPGLRRLLLASLSPSPPAPILRSLKCISSSGSSTRDADVAAWNQAIAPFEKANPDIKVDMEIVPWSEQQQRLVTALTTGGLPDVSMLGNNVVAQFQAAGSLAPLDDYFAAYDEARHQSPTTSGRATRATTYLDGHWWASPVAVETRALYYRKDLFKEAGLDPDKPPQTWEELAAAPQAIKAAAARRHRAADEPRLLHRPELHEHLSRLRRADDRRRRQVRLRHAGVQGGSDVYTRI